jgi:glucosamine--fructose-6-phosphate aminotransferase (isomerizing)
MCGIFGYVGKKNPVELALTGLKRLEYRGYDSAGIAGVKEGKILYCKEVGKVSALEKEVMKSGIVVDVVIAHTRWATHGVPSVANAHRLFQKSALVFSHSYELHFSTRVLHFSPDNQAKFRNTLTKTS